jgi:hypothetical protein
MVYKDKSEKCRSNEVNYNFWELVEVEFLEHIFPKSDAQVGRVNTFHILQTIRKRPSTFRFCMERPLRFPNF